MTMKYFCPVMIAIALVGCTATQPPMQKAQQSKVSPTRTLDMEALCKAQAAQRYNTGAQKIAVTGFEQFQEAMRCVVIPSVKRVLSALLMQMGSFYIFLCGKSRVW